MAPPSSPLAPVMQPPSDVALASLLPIAGASASDAFQNLSLHGTHASLDSTTPADGDYGGGSTQKEVQFHVEEG